MKLSCLAAVAAILGSASAARADYATAALGTANPGSYSIYGDGTDANSNYIAAEFDVVGSTFNMVGVGATFDGSGPGGTGDVWIVTLAALTDPASVPSAAVASATFAFPASYGDFTIPLSIDLPAGDYVTVFGVTDGASGSGLATGNSPIDPQNISESDGDSAFDVSLTDSGIRIFEVPEPAGMTLLGLGLAGISALRRRAAR